MDGITPGFALDGSHFRDHVNPPTLQSFNRGSNRKKITFR
jgi:hypothetical protein